VTAHLDKPQLAAPRNGGAPGPRASARPAYFPGLGMTDTACYVGQDLAPGFAVAGPAVIEEATTTIVVPPGSRLRVNPLGDYVIDLEEAV
jgi:N-methylhydantoinase A